jgi:hypothetical protein
MENLFLYHFMSTTNATCTGPESNLGFQSKKPAIELQSRLQDSINMVMNLQVQYKVWKFLSNYMTVTFFYQMIRM